MSLLTGAAGSCHAACRMQRVLGCLGRALPADAVLRTAMAGARQQVWPALGARIPAHLPQQQRQFRLAPVCQAVGKDPKLAIKRVTKGELAASVPTRDLHNNRGDAPASRRRTFTCGVPTMAARDGHASKQQRLWAAGCMPGGPWYPLPCYLIASCSGRSAQTLPWAMLAQPCARRFPAPRPMSARNLPRCLCWPSPPSPVSPVVV